MRIDKDGTGLLLSVDYYTNSKIRELDTLPLPPDVCKCVAEFAYNHLRLQFKISFPSDYPFSPPNWSLASMDSSLPLQSSVYGGMTLQDYYVYLVDMHNEQYGIDVWSPVITIEKDVLLFVRRIHHFRSIVGLM